MRTCRFPNAIQVSATISFSVIVKRQFSFSMFCYLQIFWTLEFYGPSYSSKIWTTSYFACLKVVHLAISIGALWLITVVFGSASKQSICYSVILHLCAWLIFPFSSFYAIARTCYPNFKLVETSWILFEYLIPCGVYFYLIGQNL